MENKLYEFDLEKGAVIGVDEAGRGPLAGPVVAAAAILKEYSPELDIINDSKKLSEKKRELIFKDIDRYFEIGVGVATVEEIDEINILNATFLAMRRAIEELSKKGIKVEEYKILVDGNHKIREFASDQEPIIKGDSKSLSIAAASIVAKVTRDHLMVDIIEQYPDYEFEKHKGYGTKRHRELLLEKGATAIHRKTFLKKILATHE